MRAWMLAAGIGLTLAMAGAAGAQRARAGGDDPLLDGGRDSAALGNRESMTASLPAWATSLDRQRAQEIEAAADEARGTSFGAAPRSGAGAHRGAARNKAQASATPSAGAGLGAPYEFRPWPGYPIWPPSGKF